MKNEYDDFYKFTIIRHPIDKLLSILRFRNRRKPLWPSKKYSQGSFISAHKDKIISIINPTDEFLRFDNSSELFLTPYFYENEEIIVDDIFRYENLKEDWKTICSRINISYEELPHLNKSHDNKHFTEILDMETIKFFEDFFSEEIERLGYEFIT